jgi:hypothetical protein
MDYDAFILWLNRVDGFLEAKKWPAILGALDLWVVSQYAFNDDFRVFRNDSPTKACSIKGFGTWFARVYEKDFPNGSKALRNEVHSREEKSLDEFIMMASGGMTAVQILQALPIFTQNMNSLRAWTQKMAVKVGKLADRESSRDNVVADLSGVLADLVVEVRKLRAERCFRKFDRADLAWLQTKEKLIPRLQ